MAHHQNDNSSDDALEHRRDSTGHQQPRTGPHSPTPVLQRAQAVLRWGRVVTEALKLAHDIAHIWPWSLL